MLYETEIQESGNTEIFRIVNETSLFGHNPERLNQIAYLITSNFTNPNWNQQRNEDFFCYYPQVDYYNYCCLLGPEDLSSVTTLTINECKYMRDKTGRIRQYHAVYGEDLILNSDPYWIAYQKTGECQELSILFNKTANESGFISRIVRSDGNGHFWNEIKIDGEWKFFDVQRFGMRDTNNSSKWFGNTSNYADAYPWTLCNMINQGNKPGIYVYDINTGGYGENRDHAYDPNEYCLM